MSRYRETDEVAAGVCRQVASLGRRVGSEDPASLVYLAAVEEAARLARAGAVEALRETGYTDVQIGEVLGISRQAVQQAWPRTERFVGAGARWR